MKNKITKSWLLFSLLYSLISFAKIDPVSWQLSPATGFPVTQVGGQSVVTYTLTSHLPRPAVIITAIAVSGAGMTVADGCNNVLLSPHASCFITVIFAPTQTGITTFQLIYGYHNNRIPLQPLVALAQGGQATYSLGGAIPNFPATINPTGTVRFAAVFRNTGTANLTDCFAGNILGANQFTLNPANTAQLTVTHNNCGTLASPISLAPKQFCAVSGTLSAPYQSGPFTLSALLNCAQASSEPSVSSTVVQQTASLTGTFTSPSPFPAFFYSNQAPYITATFQNTGTVELTNCQVATSTGFSVNPTTAAQISTTQPTTCGTSGSTVTLEPGATCSIYGQLTNLQVTPNVDLTAAVNCTQTNGSVEKSFAIQTASGACTTISMQTILPFPTNTYKYADNVLKFQVTNTCEQGQGALQLGQVSVVPGPGTATVAPIPAMYDTCSGQLLAPGQSCTITASITPMSLGSLGVTASVTPNGGSEASATTSTTVASNQQSTHHILFVNQCNFNVWYGISNGNGSGCNPASADCMTPDPNLINNPNGAPLSAYQLNAQVPGQAPSTIDLTVSSYQNGAFWPRTGCAFNAANQLICATGTCNSMPNSGTCQNTSSNLAQPQPPYTKFEATILAAPGTDGIYDVSAIAGMNVPVEVKAFGPSAGNTPSTAYTCSGAGALMQPTSNDALGNCTWQYDPSSTITGTNINNDFYWVTPGTDDACSSSQPPSLCGEAWGSGPDGVGVMGTPINRRLGSFLAFNTLWSYAAPGYGDPNTWGSVDLFTRYGLNVQIAGQTSSLNYGTYNGAVIFPGNTYLSYYALISCPAVTTTNALNSCYQSPTDNYFPFCCGCINWTNTSPSDKCGYQSGGQYTTGMNLSWTGDQGATIPATFGTYTPQQAVAWIKNACPTAYAYTYDDPSSSFSCTSDGGTPLYTSYQVTFCPGGVSGLPIGASDGRSVPPV